MFTRIRRALAGRPAPRTPIRVRPGVERLDARECPAVLSYIPLSGSPGMGGLIINANNPTRDEVDTVIVRENHVTNTLTVTHNPPGGGTRTELFDSTRVGLIEVHLGAGDDKFRYDLAGGGAYTDPKTVNVDLGNGKVGGVGDLAILNLSAGVRNTVAQFAVGGGAERQTVDVTLGPVDGSAGLTQMLLSSTLGAGDDRFTMHQTGDLIGMAYVNVNVFGQDGADDLTFETPDGRDADLAADAELHLGLIGGGGEDEIAVSYRGDLDGILGLALEGGADRDVIEVTAAALSGSTGDVQGSLRGGDERDVIIYVGPYSSPTGPLFIDGGMGLDLIVVNGVSTNN